MSKSLSPAIADPYEVFHSVHRQLRLWQIIAALLFSSLLVVGAVLVLVTSRHPVVIIKDNVLGAAPRIVRQADVPATTETEARVFFLNMLQLRFGWDSLTVERDMSDYLDQCHSEQGVFERSYLDEAVSVGKDRGAEAMQRKAMWVRSQIRNTVLLPESLNEVQCKWDPEQSWSCFVRARIATQKLFPPFMAQPPLRRSMFVATLLPVEHSVQTPYGLLVGVMREIPDEAREATP